MNETGSGDHAGSLDKPAPAPVAGSKTSLLTLTATALAVLSASVGSNTRIALGLSYALVTAAGILLVERARGLAQQSRSNGSSVIYSANGFLAQPEDAERGGGSSTADIIRDACAAAAGATMAASAMLESWRFGGLAYHGWAGQSMSGNWASRHGYLAFAVAVGAVLMHVVVYSSLLLMVSEVLSSLYLFRRKSHASKLQRLAPSLQKSHLLESAILLTSRIIDYEAGRVHDQPHPFGCCRLLTADCRFLYGQAMVRCSVCSICLRVLRRDGHVRIKEDDASLETPHFDHRTFLLCPGLLSVANAIWLRCRDPPSRTVL